MVSCSFNDSRLSYVFLPRHKAISSLAKPFSLVNNFNGISISVFSPADSLWHQAWADNSGGYINLIGKVEGEKRYFETPVEKKGDKTIIRRMVFYNITADSFTWDWELSNDGGKTWALQWQILYERAKE